jgi:hypothetical protein
MQCGPIVSTMAETQAQIDLIKKVVIRETNFCLPVNAPPQPAIHQIWEWLVQDQDRLRLGAMDVIESLELKRFPLILSDRKNQSCCITRNEISFEEKSRLAKRTGLAAPNPILFTEAIMGKNP